MSTKPAILTTVLAIAMGTALLHGHARCGDCCDIRPRLFPVWEPIPCCALHYGRQYTLNPLRFAHRTYAPCCQFPWLGLGFGGSSCGCEGCATPAPCCGCGEGGHGDVPAVGAPETQAPPVPPSAAKVRPDVSTR